MLCIASSPLALDLLGFSVGRMYDDDEVRDLIGNPDAYSFQELN